VEETRVEGQLNPKSFVFYCNDIFYAYCKGTILARTSKDKQGERKLCM